MYSFHILRIWAYLAYKIELIRPTLTFKNSSFVAFLQRVYDNCFTFSSSGKALLKRGFDTSQRQRLQIKKRQAVRFISRFVKLTTLGRSNYKAPSNYFCSLIKGVFEHISRLSQKKHLHSQGKTNKNDYVYLWGQIGSCLVQNLH